MANSYAGLFSTVVSAFNRASLAKEARNVLVTMVTRDFEPKVAQKFAAINTNIVQLSGTPTNLASGGSVTLTDQTIDPKPVTLNQFPAYGFPIPNFDASRTSDTIVDKLRDAALKVIGNGINGYIASLITTAKFTTNQVTATGTATITDAKMGEGWAKLAGSDVPVGDMGNLFLATNHTVYANLLQSASWTQNAYIGDPKSGDIRSTARLGLQWGAICDFDPDMPIVSASIRSLLFHRNAIALVARAPEPPISDAVPYAYASYKGIPILMTIDWNNLAQQNEIVFTALYGAEVIREDHGCIMTTT